MKRSLMFISVAIFRDLHKEINPQCPIVKFGYPAEPDGYTVNQFVQMMQDAVGNKLVSCYDIFSAFLRGLLIKMEMLT